MKILLGISGGIAAYKMPNFVRLCIKHHHEVQVLLTPAAARFVSPMTLKVLSGNPVWIEDFDPQDRLAHIHLADWADVFVLAPATANTLAKIAVGMGDNLLTSTVLALTCRKIAFPAMNVHMYNNPATQLNLQKLPSLGWEVVTPDSGSLACGYEGKGRLSDDDTLLAHIERNPNGPLKGQKILVTAGATLETIDPVRFLSNRSTGKMGLALALAAYRLGASVTLIHGKVSVLIPTYLTVHGVETTSEMLDILSQEITSADALIMAAAPSDFRPLHPSSQKIKKTTDTLKLELTQNPDILKTLIPKKGKCKIIGFALESDHAHSNAIQKLQSKNMDWIVLNQISDKFHPMDSNQNRILLISSSSETNFEGDKSEVALYILQNTLAK